jgi:cytochrome c oxidase cbb3-type subunit 1
MFGAIYAVLPRITQTDFPRPRLVRVHFWLALLGVLLIVVPLIIGGIVQARQLHDPDVAFMAVVKATLPFLRASTTGYLLLALGHLVFLFNIATLADRLYRTRTVAAYAAVTSELTPIEVKA